MGREVVINDIYSSHTRNKPSNCTSIGNLNMRFHIQLIGFSKPMRQHISVSQ
jgi:hypothetical protein